MYRSVKGLTGFAQLGVLLAFLGFGFILAGLTQLVIAMQIIPAGESITKDGVLLKALMDPANVTASRIAQVTGTLCLFFIPAYLFSIVSNGVSFRWLGFNKNFTIEQVFLAFFIILAASISASPLADISKNIVAHFPKLNTYAQGLEDAYNAQVKALSNLKSWPEYLVALAIMAFFPAMFEEVFFRGVVQRFFEKWWKSPWLAITLAAFIFTLFHSSVYLFATRMILGIALGFIFYSTRNIWVNIIAHFLNNAIALTQMFVLSKQNKPIEVDKLDPNIPWIWSLVTLVVLILLCYRITKISREKRRLIEENEAVHSHKYIRTDNPFEK